jgi:AcrR family transcriptional regulator
LGSSGLKKPGLRERKKARTREQIVAAARDLFVERGYEGTSIADIAEGADIAVSTFFAYFPSKADVLFTGYDEVLDDYIASVEARAAGESAIEASMRWHHQRRLLSSPHAPETPESRDAVWLTTHLRRIVDADPVLQAVERQRYRRTEEFLAREVASDLGDAETDLRPQLIAAAKISLIITLVRHLSNETELDPVETGAYVDACLKATADAIARVPLPPAR